MKKKNWTRKVYEHFSSQLPILVEVTTDTTSTHTTDALLPNEIRFNDNQKDAVIYIEGPFSTCTSYIFDCEHVVLIGGGIGITPYISALKNLIHQLREERCICSKCGAANYNKKKLNSRKLKKVDFIWINRDVGNFSWFLNTLDEFEAEQESYLNSTENSQEIRSRYLDIHLYCTSIRRNKEMLGHLPYDLVANMHEIIQHEDMLTQLRTPTHVGRPPWKLLFAKFKAEHRSTHVFFTGNKIMGEEIKEYCDEHGFAFNHEPYF
jgi:NADPH oxidase